MDVTFLLLSHPWSYNRANSCSQSTQSECSIRLSLKKLAVYKPGVYYLSLLSIKASKVCLGRDETLPQTSRTRTILSKFLFWIFLKCLFCTHTHDPRLPPTTHDPRQLAILSFKLLRDYKSKIECLKDDRGICFCTRTPQIDVIIYCFKWRF